MTSPPGYRAKWINRLVRWGVTFALLGLLVWYAGGTLRTAVDQLTGQTIEITPHWVLASAALYVVGLSPMAFFWWHALDRLGEKHPLRVVLRGYYLGHLGKYVPGKALVVILRTKALTAAGASPRATVVSVFMETLTFMATGAALAAGLIVLTGHATLSVMLMALGLATVAGAPVTPPIARLLARRVVGKPVVPLADSVDPIAGITWNLSATGVLAATVSWVLLGLSLWAAVRGLGVDQAQPLGQLGLWVEATTLPMVAGFLSLLPGGLGIRDTLLVELLSANFSPATALVAAALWRIISIASETTVCGIMETSRLYRRFLPPHDTP